MKCLWIPLIFFEDKTKLKILSEIKPPLKQAVCVGDKSYLVENI